MALAKSKKQWEEPRVRVENCISLTFNIRSVLVKDFKLTDDSRVMNNRTEKKQRKMTRVINISAGCCNITDVAEYIRTSLFSARESLLHITISGAKPSPQPKQDEIS